MPSPLGKVDFGGNACISAERRKRSLSLYKIKENRGTVFFGRPAQKPELRSCTRCVHPLVPRVSGCRPPVRWGPAIEVSFLFRGFLYGRAAQRRPYRILRQPLFLLPTPYCLLPCMGGRRNAAPTEFASAAIPVPFGSADPISLKTLHWRVFQALDVPVPFCSIQAAQRRPYRWCIINIAFIAAARHRGRHNGASGRERA